MTAADLAARRALPMKGPAMQRDRVVWAAGRSSARWRAGGGEWSQSSPYLYRCPPRQRRADRRLWVGSGRFNQSRRTESQEDSDRPNSAATAQGLARPRTAAANAIPSAAAPSPTDSVPTKRRGRPLPRLPRLAPDPAGFDQ